MIMAKAYEHNQGGFITLDFLFAFVLVMGFSALLFALTITLTMVEITQYVTFAAARNYAAAHTQKHFQMTNATRKFQYLTTEHPTFSRLYNNGWFEIETDLNNGNLGNLAEQLGYEIPGGHPNLFVGAGTPFRAKMLELNIPFYGATTDSEGDDEEGFSTYIGSYLLRETTTFECTEYTNARWNLIRSFNQKAANYTQQGAGGQFVSVVTDNGC